MDENNNITPAKKTDPVKREDEHIPVYEVEIIDENEENGKIVPKYDTPPGGKLAYKLGKAAGSVMAAIGFINEIRKVFRGENRTGSGKERPGGKGMRRKRKMRRSG